MGEKKAEVPVGKELVRMTGIMKEFPGVKACLLYTSFSGRCIYDKAEASFRNRADAGNG